MEKTLFKFRHVWLDGTELQSEVDGETVTTIVPYPRAKQKIVNTTLKDFFNNEKVGQCKELLEALRSNGGSVPLNASDEPNSVDFGDWDADASSCFLGEPEQSGLILRPVRAYYNHYRTLHDESTYPQAVCIDILCETYDPRTKEPHELNHRAQLRQIVDPALESDLSGEIEYYMFKRGGLILPPMKKIEYPFEQGKDLQINGSLKTTQYYEKQDYYYSRVGAKYVTEEERDLVDRHVNACAAAGINIDGTNPEVGPGQWEFQCRQKGTLHWADDITMAIAYLMWEGEKDGITIDLHPKPFAGLNGSGAHFNNSNVLTMMGNKDAFMLMVNQFIDDWEDHMKVYGHDNHLRLKPGFETAVFGEKWEYGIDDRDKAIRIRQAAIDAGWKGPIEVRVVGSNASPYLVGIEYEKSAKRAYAKAEKRGILESLAVV